MYLTIPRKENYFFLSILLCQGFKGHTVLLNKQFLVCIDFLQNLYYTRFNSCVFCFSEIHKRFARKGENTVDYGTKSHGSNTRSGLVAAP